MLQSEQRADRVAHFDRMADGWDGWQRRNRYYYGQMARLLRLLVPPGSRVLELGCATGDVLMILDADLSVAPEVLSRFYRVLIEGHGEFLNGSRMVYQMERQAMRLLNLKVCEVPVRYHARLYGETKISRFSA